MLLLEQGAFQSDLSEAVGRRPIITKGGQESDVSIVGDLKELHRVIEGLWIVSERDRLEGVIQHEVLVTVQDIVEVADLSPGRDAPNGVCRLVTGEGRGAFVQESDAVLERLTLEIGLGCRNIVVRREDNGGRNVFIGEGCGRQCDQLTGDVEVPVV